MNIVLLTHPTKTEQMIQLCIAYSGILGMHSLYAPDSLGALILEAAGLPVMRFMKDSQAGVRQLDLCIARNEVDMLLFFPDTDFSRLHDVSGHEIIRLCDNWSVPVATNMGTAEVLIHGLHRGDLDWRNYSRANTVSVMQSTG